jgi:hypothetical protein
MLPADLLHCFNFFTILIIREYLKLDIEVVPAYSSVKKPIYLTSGCNKLFKVLSFLCIQTFCEYKIYDLCYLAFI